MSLGYRPALLTAAQQGLFSGWGRVKQYTVSTAVHSTAGQHHGREDGTKGTSAWFLGWAIDALCCGGSLQLNARISDSERFM